MNSASARVPVLATALTLALRAAYLLQIRHNPYFVVPVMDEGYHDQWAHEIAAGNLTGQIPFFRAPLYPFLLGAGYALFGPAYGLLRTLQVLLGAATPALTWAVARRLLPGRPGLWAVAAFVAAADVMLMYFEAELLLESLLAPLGTLLVLLVLRAGDTGSAGRWALVGVALGLFAITRPNILLFAPIAFVLALGWRGDSFRLRRFRWRPAAALTAATCAFVLPVTAVNGIVGHDPALVATQGGLNFYLGNNEEANGWSATAPSIMRLDWWGALQDATAIAEAEAGRPLKPTEVSDYWYGRALAWWRAHPVDALALTFEKVTYFFAGTEFGNNRNIDLFFREYAPLARPGIGLAFVMMPLALVGAGTVWRRGGLPGRAALLLGAAYVASVVLFFVTARYRVPVRPLLTILAVAGGARVVEGIRAGELRGWVPAAVAVALGVGLNANPWIRGYRPSPAQFYQSVANVVRDRGDLDEAIAVQEKALAIDPTYPEANLNLGTMYMSQGRVPEAIAAFRRELALDPDDGPAWASLARALARTGDVAAAEWAYSQAEANGLEDAPPLYNHALLLERLGRPEDAVALYERAVAADPSFVEALNNLGVLHARAGRVAQAVPLWEEVLRLDPAHAGARDNLARARAMDTSGGGTGPPDATDTTHTTDEARGDAESPPIGRTNRP